jgi:hypothetical protein
MLVLSLNKNSKRKSKNYWGNRNTKIKSLRSKNKED